MSSDDTNDRPQTEIAADALRAKQAMPDDHRPPNDDHAADGHANTPRPDHPPSGAFDAEGHRPVLERSRKVR